MNLNILLKCLLLDTDSTQTAHSEGGQLPTNEENQQVRSQGHDTVASYPGLPMHGIFNVGEGLNTRPAPVETDTLMQPVCNCASRIGSCTFSAVVVHGP